MENINDKIIIYQTDDGQTQIDVRLENETVWLTQAQMALLFEKTPQNITMHIRNAYSEGELDERATCKEFLQVRREGVREIKRMQKFYDLDVIISVGYRVKSQRGTAFRIWARNVLKDYLVKGYAVNERIHKEQIGELRQLVGMLGRTIQNQPLLSTDETNALFDVVTDYTYALDTLDSYDYQRLTVSDTTSEAPFRATYDNAMQAIHSLKERFGESTLFGNEKDESFKSSIGQIYQTFDGVELYPSTEEKAAMHAALSRHQEPFVQRRQQTHRRHAVLVVSEQQPHPLPRGRQQAHSRQHPCGSHADDCRKPPRRERCDGKSGSKPH